MSEGEPGEWLGDDDLQQTDVNDDDVNQGVDQWVETVKPEIDWDDGPFIDVRTTSVAFYEETKFVKGCWWFIIFLVYFFVLLSVLVFQMNVPKAHDFDQMLQDRYFHSKFGENLDLVEDVSSIDMLWDYLILVWAPNTFNKRVSDWNPELGDGTQAVGVPDTNPSPSSTASSPPTPIIPTAPPLLQAPATPAPPSSISTTGEPATPAAPTPSPFDGVKPIDYSVFKNSCYHTKPLTNATEYTVSHSKLARTPLLWQSRYDNYVEPGEANFRESSRHKQTTSGRVWTHMQDIGQNFDTRPVVGKHSRVVYQPFWKDPEQHLIVFCINEGHCSSITDKDDGQSGGGVGDDGKTRLPFPQNLTMYPPHVNVTCPEAAADALKQLRKDEWIDERTAFVVVETTYYNPYYNMAALLRLVFVQTRGGRIMPLASWLDDHSFKHKASTIQVQRLWEINADVEDIVHFTVAAVFALLTLAATAFEVFMVIRAKKQSHTFLSYFRQPKNWVQLVTLVLTYAAIVFYLIFLATSSKADKDTLNLKDEEWEVERLFLTEKFHFSSRTIYWVFTALLILLFMCRVLCSIGFARRWRFLSMTIIRAGPELLSFGAIVGLILMGYGFSGYYYFGHGLKNFATPLRGIQTLLLLSIGMPRTEYDDLAGTTDVSAFLFPALFYWSFIIVFYFAMINMGLAIVMAAYTVTSEELGKDSVPQRTFFKKIVNPWGQILTVMQRRGWLDLVYHEYPIGLYCTYHFANNELVLRFKINLLSQGKVSEAKHLMIVLPPSWTVISYNTQAVWISKKALTNFKLPIDINGLPLPGVVGLGKKSKKKAAVANDEEPSNNPLDNMPSDTDDDEVPATAVEMQAAEDKRKVEQYVECSLVNNEDTSSFTPIMQIACPKGFEEHESVVKISLEASASSMKRFISGGFQLCYTEGCNLAAGIGEGASFEELPYLVFEPRVSVSEFVAAPAEAGVQGPRRSKWTNCVQYCEKFFPWQED